jgi:hypothetical protein
MNFKSTLVSDKQAFFMEQGKREANFPFLKSTKNWTKHRQVPQTHDCDIGESGSRDQHRLLRLCQNLSPQLSSPLNADHQ